MHVRVSIFAITLAIGTMHGCCGVGYEPWQDSEVIDLGVSADLHAMVGFRTPGMDERYYSYLAVGAEGTVVAWGEEHFGLGEPFVERFSVGDADLHAVWADDSSWWAVGDGGLAVVSEDFGQTWTSVDLAGSVANLRAISSDGVRITMVGDGVVLVREDADRTWSEAPAPAEGWGQLRGVYDDGARSWAVGLGGVIWSTEHPGGEWIAEASGVGTDLFAVARIYDGNERVAAVGAAGTLLVRDAGTWSPTKTRQDVDLVGLRNGIVLGAGGEVFEQRDNGKLKLIDTIAGARAFSFGYGSYDGVVVVGDDGAAAGIPSAPCGVL
jgi:photosystem II stability/assembly factor-like uncharacterized protein